MAAISVWNDSYGSMGPLGHVGQLDLVMVMGAIPSPQWIPNGGWRWSFLAKKNSMSESEGDPVATFLANIATQVTVISGCSSLLGSMGPRAHTKYFGQAVGAIVNAP